MTAAEPTSITASYQSRGFRCFTCGQMRGIDEMAYHRRIERAGDYPICAVCARANGNLQCDGCHNWEPSYEMVYAEPTEQRLCNRCQQEYLFECDHCHKFWFTASKSGEGESCPVCMAKEAAC